MAFVALKEANCCQCEALPANLRSNHAKHLVPDLRHLSLKTSDFLFKEIMETLKYNSAARSCGLIGDLKC